MAQAITVTDIRKNFGAVEALKGVSLDVAEGEKVVVIGPSGSGKSVLIRCINGLEVPDSGTVVVEGMNLSDRKVNARALARDVAMVFQSYNLYPHKTVLENVTLAPIKVLKVPREQAERDGRAYLERVGLSDKVDKYPDQLSGGQQQRVAIARALITKPKLVFADEPTGNLDSVSSAEVLGFLKRSVNELGQTIVMVTHDAVAASYADRAIVFSDGRIVADEQHPNAEVMNELLMAERERTTRTTLTDTPADQMAQMAGVRNVPDLPITDAPLPPAVPTSGCEGTLRHARAAARHAR